MYKYETPYKVLFEITHACTNGKVALYMDPKTVRFNMCRINPYKLKTDVDDMHM